MSKKSGVAGKTIPALARSRTAAVRQAARDGRRADEQLGLLALRPGRSSKERARLAVPA